ncbi:DNA-binding transcriptional regulator, LysR family [Jannaschia faecimaris]|uniref:DNA-binding transcriptional regulator, LysR family n=1 Tax=Jannaschia faecimaris TaxID=1244108 RepID=A0A1H3S4H8_9RHOB|nr:LysR family transcriptional regulator [Jannaschia faecimaris]SDZ32832.1 DNA-binding transcriptional regulator, LysR family [Jannaschia faecimaris]
MALHLVPRSLQYFEHVAQLGSIQAASRELGISASAIHRQITAIEDSLGEQLFDRDAKGMTLTSTGYLLLELARDWRLDSARLWSTMLTERGVEQGHIRLAAMDGMVNGFVPELVAEIARVLPRVQVDIKITSPDNAVKEVLNGDVDIAAVVNVAPDDNLWFHWTRDFPLGCIATPSHAVAQRPNIGLSDLIEYPVVFQDSSLAIRKLLEARHSWIFDRTKNSVVVNSIQLMKMLVGSGQYLAVTSELDAEPEIRSGRLKFIPISNEDVFRQKFSVISNLQMPATTVISQVVALCVDILERRTVTVG